MVPASLECDGYDAEISRDSGLLVFVAFRAYLLSLPSRTVVFCVAAVLAGEELTVTSYTTLSFKYSVSVK